MFASLWTNGAVRLGRQSRVMVSVLRGLKIFVSARVEDLCGLTGWGSLSVHGLRVSLGA